jgi:hypothetical protein
MSKNVPNNPSLWSKAKAKAKSKFSVYPSAYANGYAVREYKKMGGTWRKGTTAKKKTTKKK